MVNERSKHYTDNTTQALFGVIFLHQEIGSFVLTAKSVPKVNLPVGLADSAILKTDTHSLVDYVAKFRYYAKFTATVSELLD